MEDTKTTAGRVIAVRGAVVDVDFDGAALPPIDDALVIARNGGAPITLEVQAHLSQKYRSRHCAAVYIGPQPRRHRPRLRRSD